MVTSPPRASAPDRPPRAAVLDRRVPIGTKLGAVMAVMIAMLVTTATVLYSDVRTVAAGYEQLLVSPTRTIGLRAEQMETEFKLQVQEWKNILLRGSDPADLETYTRQFREQIATVEAIADDIEVLTDDPGVRAELALFRTEYAALNAAYDAALAPFVADGAQDPRPTDRAVRGLDRPIDDRIQAISQRAEAVLAERIAAQNEAVAARQGVLLVSGLLVLALVLAALAFVVTRIVRPIKNLTTAAYDLAHEALPRAIEEIRTSPADAAVPQLPALSVPTKDELDDLAAALTTVQSRAVELAVEQHRAEREAAQMLINLGRRNQSLLKRTLGYITDLEAQERDSDVLEKLFRLDHATTRIRRNAESMLVLAGAAQTRTWSRAVAVGDVMRAALSEIEDYVRVDMHYVEDRAVVGNAVADVVHLLAELLENATHFSPPGARVTVVGQRVPDGYRIRVVDQGVGMTDAELRAANERIVRAADGRASSQLLGLYVVGRLASRRKVRVLLEPSAGHGTTATVVLPPEILADPAEGTLDRESSASAALVGVPADRGVPLRAAEPRAAVAAPAPPVPGGSTTRRAADPRHDEAVPLPVRAASAPPQAPQPGGSAPFGVGDLFAPVARHRQTEDGIPQRVRGAQLPDLGPGVDDGPAFAPPDPELARGRLSALISGVESGRADGGGGAHLPGDGR